LKEDLFNAAIITCQSDKHTSEAEFALYMMKFSNNKAIKPHLENIERRISQLLEFNPMLRAKNDPESNLFIHFLMNFD
jgi:hypothetical protein